MIDFGMCQWALYIGLRRILVAQVYVSRYGYNEGWKDGTHE
jgi:hypothetical protein